MRVLTLFAGLCLLSLLCQAPADAKDPVEAAEEQVLKDAKLPIDNASLLAALRKRVLPEANQQVLQNLLHQLGSDQFTAREKAHAALLAQGLNALSVLRQAENSPDVEMKKQAEGLCNELETRAKADQPIQMAVVRLLGVRQPAEATEVLLAYLPFAPDENVADEVRNALTAANKRARQPNPALLEALADKSPARRGSAAEVLCRLGAKNEQITTLLQDADPSVRPAPVRPCCDRKTGRPSRC